MNYAEKFIIISPNYNDERFELEFKIEFFDSMKDVEKRIIELHETKVPNLVSDQRMDTLSYFFEKGAAYPTTIETFKTARNSRDRHGRVMGMYILQYVNKKGKTIQKTYDWIEDVEDRLDSLQEKGITDILLIHTDESTDAKYFYQKNIIKLWG